ncbi:MAG: hypothetical protein JRE20_11550, partial [Deltaproteobacteria bacterium]|nr:hypothetical protein [Deltaproteobacteria bacterium]
MDSINGWVAGEYGTLLHSSDGGKTWEKQESGVGTVSLYGVYFKDKNQGWVVGMDGVLIATADGGTNWKKLESGTDKHLYSISLIGDKARSVGTRGAYIVSNDGGLNWKKKKKAIRSQYWF